MSLEGIFDPLVRAHFSGKAGSGGSAVDDGYYIEWDGSTDGREIVLVMGAFTLYKVSDIVLDVTKLTGVRVFTSVSGNKLIDYGVSGSDKVVGGEGWCAIVIDGYVYVVSGVAGTHSFAGMDVIIPTDGTYFLHHDFGDTRAIGKSAPT